MFSNHFFDPIYFLGSLLQLLFVESANYFFTIVIDYLVRHRIRILNTRYSKRLFTPSRSVPFFECILLLHDSNLIAYRELGLIGSKISSPYKFIHTVFSLIFRLALMGVILMEVCLVSL